MNLVASLLFLAPTQTLLAPQYPQYQYPQYPTYQQQRFLWQNYQNGPKKTYSYPTYSQQPYTSQSVSYPSYPSTRQYAFSSYPTSYQQQQQQTSSYSYPAYQPQQTYQQQQQQQQRSGRGESGRAYQDPVFNYMITDMSYFGPEPEVSRPSRSSPPSAYTTSTERPAWQGKVDGQARTRCHDGILLPFRARCNKVKECSNGEDEFDCDWHKRSPVDTITTVQQFERLLHENENVMVEFFAPWCPACVTFLPHLETLKEANADLPLTVVKVNTDDDPELKELFSVNTFPRILLWSKRWGERDLTNGHRTYNKSWGMNATNIQQWINDQLL